jgi:hypothetical protein
MINLIDLQFVQITAQYSNAVLMAILPHVSDFAGKMDLPVPLPVTVQQVQAFASDHLLGDVGGVVRLTNGYIFEFAHGHVRSFKTSDCYSDLQDPRLVPRFYGELRMTTEEAIDLCRATIRKLGYTEEMLYADLPPARIEYPPRLETNVVPRYVIDWVDPREGSRSCEFEVNGQEKRVEEILFFSKTLWRAPPQIDVIPQIAPGSRKESLFQPVNPEYARRLLTAILPAVSDYARRLELPIVLPVTTNQVATCVCRKYEGAVYVDLTLTNRHRFFYQYGMVMVYDAPDTFFDYTKPGVRVKDFVGSWNLDEAQAVELARDALGKLGYSAAALSTDEPPEVTRPQNVSNVPRFRIDWIKGANMMLFSRVLMEVDAEHKAVKSILVWSPALQRPLPDLGVPPDIPHSVPEPVPAGTARTE